MLAGLQPESAAFSRFGAARNAAAAKIRLAQSRIPLAGSASKDSKPAAAASPTASQAGGRYRRFRNKGLSGCVGFSISQDGSGSTFVWL